MSRLIVFDRNVRTSGGFECQAKVVLWFRTSRVEPHGFLKRQRCFEQVVLFEPDQAHVVMRRCVASIGLDCFFEVWTRCRDVAVVQVSDRLRRHDFGQRSVPAEIYLHHMPVAFEKRRASWQQCGTHQKHQNYSCAPIGIRSRLTRGERPTQALCLVR